MTDRDRSSDLSDPHGDDVTALAGRLQQVALLLVRRLRREDDALGLSAAQLSTVTTLVQRGPLTPGELARSEGVRPPTMTRRIQRLEQDGYVIRKPSPHDGRVTLVRHTTEAIRLLERARAARDRAFGVELRALAPEDRRLLGQSLAILERLSDTSDP